MTGGEHQHQQSSARVSAIHRILMSVSSHTIRSEHCHQTSSSPLTLGAEPFPETMQIHGAERSVVETIARSAALVPDHTAVIRANRSTESTVSKCAQYRRHVNMPKLGRVRYLVKAPRTSHENISQVSKVDAAGGGEASGHSRQIVLGQDA